jgi:L-fucose mutarotase
MLKGKLLHPEILQICARAGHHARILIADGNYPASTKKGPGAAVVSLQLSPGIPTVAQVLEALLSSVPVDHIHTMGIPPEDPYAAHEEPPAWVEYRKTAVDAGIVSPVTPISKWEFYEAVMSPDHILTIQTADQALWANVLLTLGCRTF